MWLDVDYNLHVHLLGHLDYEDGLRLQRHLVEQVAASHDLAALVLCEHGPCISVGRQGSHSHILLDLEELHARRWPVRWVNRGGGCILHMPGQIAMYPILPLRRMGLGLQDYLERLHRVLINVLDHFSVPAKPLTDGTGLHVDHRHIASVGVAVRDWVSWHGAVLNVAPDLLPFRHVRTSDDAVKATSLVRERHGPVRMSQVRQTLIEEFQSAFGLSRTSVLFGHPSIADGRPVEAAAT